jgi:predicted RNase H-like HicB family nuclease
MARQFDVVVEKDSEGLFVASVPALAGCYTQARSLDELMVCVKETIKLCLEVQEEDTEDLDFVGVQRVKVYACRSHLRLGEYPEYSHSGCWLSSSESEGKALFSSAS